MGAANVAERLMPTITESAPRHETEDCHAHAGNNLALKEGRVRVPGVEFEFVEVPVLIDGFPPHGAQP